jgi:hypothetical protein
MFAHQCSGKKAIFVTCIKKKLVLQKLLFTAFFFLGHNKCLLFMKLCRHVEATSMYNVKKIKIKLFEFTYNLEYMLLGVKRPYSKQFSLSDITPSVPKYKAPLIFAGQQLTNLTMIYTYNMSTKLV